MNIIPVIGDMYKLFQPRAKLLTDFSEIKATVEQNMKGTTEKT